MRKTLSRFATLIATICSSGLLAQEPLKPDPSPVTPAENTVPETLVQLGNGQHFSPYALVMDKSQRTLSVWKQQDDRPKLISAFAADFGRNSGDKVASGDAKTPEGIYFFQQEKEKAEVTFETYGNYTVHAFTLDYPNFFDGLEKKSGNGIWLHTLPDNLSLWRGSKGCIVVRPAVLKTLAEYINPKRTPIIIEDAVHYIPIAQAKQRSQDWRNWLIAWRDAWQTKNIDQYISYYADDFRAQGMSRAQWRQFKDGLNQKYKYIKVELTEPLYVVHKNQVIIKLLQDYQSDINADFGEKTLFLKKDEHDRLAIIGEEWQNIPKDGIAAK